MSRLTSGLLVALLAILVLVVYFGLDRIADRVSMRVAMRSGPSATVSTPSASLTAVSSFIYAVYAELNHTNQILGEVYGRQNAALKKELRWLDFEKNATMRKSALPAFRFRPLQQVFRDDFEELSKRWQAQRPDDALPQ